MIRSIVLGFGIAIVIGLGAFLSGHVLAASGPGPNSCTVTVNAQGNADESGNATVCHRTVLPAGFTIQQADGITYVCSESPVMCTGNKP